MKGLIHRHLQIYFSNKASVFFSLMGALINFALYLLFMKSNLASSFEGLADGTNLSNLWVLAGSLGTAAITTSLAGVGQGKTGGQGLFVDRSFSSPALSFLPPER